MVLTCGDGDGTGSFPQVVHMLYRGVPAAMQ
jgi:hypothetical protein